MRIGSAPRRNAFFAIRAVSAGTSGHGLGCIDMTGSLRPRTRGRRPPSDPAATSPTRRPGQFANRVVVAGAEAGQVGRGGRPVRPTEDVVEFAALGDAASAPGKATVPITGATEPLE